MQLLGISYFLFQLAPRNKKQWVVGTDEIAGVLESLSRALPDSYSVNLSAPGLRKGQYSLTISGRDRVRIFKRIFFGPVILGYLANQTDQFFYIWSRGFLVNRSSELRFLKRHGKKIAVMFCGDDIRSPKLHRELCQKLNRKTFTTQGFYLDPPGGVDGYEGLKREIAREAETYADVIFNAPLCQSSYLSQESLKVVSAHGFISIEPENFCPSHKKFDETVLKIIHAPSSEAVKGTAEVRKAINRLSSERDDFIYIELTNSKHEYVIQTLKSAHISLNQFLSFGTGVFGIESMAARCVTLMSANPDLEPSIPMWNYDGAPWVVTSIDEIYENLKVLLDDRDLLKTYSERGFAYAMHNYSHKAAKERLLVNLDRFGFTTNEIIEVSNCVV